MSTSSVFLNLMYVFKAILSIQRFFSLTKFGEVIVKNSLPQKCQPVAGDPFFFIHSPPNIYGPPPPPLLPHKYKLNWHSH